MRKSIKLTSVSIKIWQLYTCWDKKVKKNYPPLLTGGFGGPYFVF
jgi:hypothetical protein